MNIGEIRSRLSAAESDLEASERQLKDSRTRRAVQVARGNPERKILDRIDEEISEAKADIENLGGVIDLLRGQIPASEEEEKAKKKVYDMMVKNLDPNIRKKSDLFVKRLKEAAELNKDLLAYHAGRATTERKTGKGVSCQNICGGFHTLELLAALAEGEGRGIGRASDRWGYWFKNSLNGSDMM